ncbi:MAG: UDP-N-acetylmuramoyl-L-alanine--D-glutamate ligase [Chloroflexota bacterium]
MPDDFQGKRATLIGLARTNIALARYLVGKGASVRITDRKTRDELTRELASIERLPVELRLGGHRDEDVADADVVFATPAVPRDLPLLIAARRRGIPISSEIELLFARCRAPIIGITGSAGKTTTTSLVGEMLRAAGWSVLVGGNIGLPLIDRVDAIASDCRVIVELSSYQLEALGQSAHIGAILNVTPNHLDRHPTFEHYRECKFNLLRYQRPDDLAVLGADDPVAASLAPRCPGPVRWFSGRSAVARGAFCRGDELVVRDNGEEAVFARTGELRLPGSHNVLNVLAAAVVSQAAGASQQAIRDVATTFQGVEHRLEFVRELGGVSYYNDSIATTPERTLAALRALPGPVVLIAGGRSKHLPLSEMASAIVQTARAVIVFGEMAQDIEDAVRASPGGEQVPIERAATLDRGVRLANELAQPGDSVLLSPSGTSFDHFRDFEDRGRQFKAAVQALGEIG